MSLCPSSSPIPLFRAFFVLITLHHVSEFEWISSSNKSRAVFVRTAGMPCITPGLGQTVQVSSEKLFGRDLLACPVSRHLASLECYGECFVTPHARANLALAIIGSLASNHFPLILQEPEA